MGTSTWGRRGTAWAATLLAVAAVVVAVSEASPARAAVTGSIVYILDHDVWIADAADASTARAVTTDGTVASPYLAPTQDDHGRILAVRGGEGGDFVWMDQSGALLAAPFRPPGSRNLIDADLRGDGDVFTYTHYGSFNSGPGSDGQPTFVVAPSVDFAHPDGRDPSDVANSSFDSAYATYSSQQVFLTTYEDDSTPVVATYGPGSATVQTWFRPCELDRTSIDDFNFCFPVFADVTTAQDRVVVGVPGNDGVPTPARLFVFAMTGPPPAAPTWDCELVGPTPEGSYDAEFQNPEWSPDGTALVYEYFADPPTPGLANGIYLATGFDQGCAAAFASARLIVPGGDAPDWSPAPLGAPGVRPSASPTPGTTPTAGPTPGPTGGPTHAPTPTRTADPAGLPPTDPSIAFDGNPRTTERINITGPLAMSLFVSRTRFADGQAARVILARDDRFPDSLAGVPLTGDGPLLFTTTARLHEQTRIEIQRVLPPGGIIHVLGGPGAVSEGVTAELAALGYDIDRLSGPSRYETSVAVATRVRQLQPEGTTAGVARAFGPTGDDSAAWADSVTGGAWAAAGRVPILVTDTASLHPAVAAWLAADAPDQTVLFGGRAALSDAVEGAVPGPRRIAGGERTGTAAAIATELWGSAVVAQRRFVIIDGFIEDGWGYGLTIAGLAAHAGAPLLMVNGTEVPEPTAALVTGCSEVDLVLAGSGNVVKASVRLDELDNAC